MFSVGHKVLCLCVNVLFDVTVLFHNKIPALTRVRLYYLMFQIIIVSKTHLDQACYVLVLRHETMEIQNFYSFLFVFISVGNGLYALRFVSLNWWTMLWITTL